MVVEGQNSYKRALRVIGQYLDSEPVYRMSISEVADGFTVRSHPTPTRPDERVRHFPWNSLGDLDTYNAARRALKGLEEKKARYRPLWENFPCGHEQALRVLGTILDDDGASDLSIDEVEKGISVSYVAHANGGGEERRERVFSPDELCSSAEAGS